MIVSPSHLPAIFWLYTPGYLHIFAMFGYTVFSHPLLYMKRATSLTTKLTYTHSPSPAWLLYIWYPLSRVTAQRVIQCKSIRSDKAWSKSVLVRIYRLIYSAYRVCRNWENHASHTWRKLIRDHTVIGHNTFDDMKCASWGYIRCTFLCPYQSNHQQEKESFDRVISNTAPLHSSTAE